VGLGGEDWGEGDGAWFGAWFGAGELIDLHSMVLWDYYEVDLHDACIPFNSILIALEYCVY